MTSHEMQLNYLSREIVSGKQIYVSRNTQENFLICYVIDKNVLVEFDKIEWKT